MTFLRAALARITGMFTKHRADDELREELEAHLAMETAEYIRRGMPPAAARRRALVASGGLAMAAESVRDQRGLPWLEGIGADLRYAVRSLRRTPGFTAIVVVTLALGIGANTAIFSAVRAVLLEPLPHRDGDRLVYLRQSSGAAGGRSVLFSVPEASDYRAGSPSFEGIAEYSPWSETVQEAGGAERIDVALVTGNFFEVMGLSPLFGRLTRPSDDGADAPPVVVLTHSYWVSHFRGDSTVVGTPLIVDGAPVMIIGVVQPAPFFPDRVDALFNMAISPHHLSAQMVQNRSHRMTELVARLAPGATMEAARRDVAAVQSRLAAQYGGAYDPGSQYRVSVIPFKEAVVERARVTLWLLMGAAGLVLLIATANVANLTLMRGLRRQHELVVRAALGAGVGRLRRLLLVENLSLAGAGAAMGGVIAVGGVRVLTTFAARYTTRASEIRLDGVVLGFTVALAVVVALLLSLASSLPGEGMLANWISAGVRRMKGSVRIGRLQRVLVVAQVAVSVMLLAAAGLLTRTMVHIAEVSTGLRAESVLTIPVSLLNPARMDSSTDSTIKAQYDRMRSEIRALPGVIEVGLGSTMPLRVTPIDFDMRVEGRASIPGEPIPHADFRTASPEYFRAAGIPLRGGRPFSAHDREGTERVVIINQTLADRYFRGRNPIGLRLAWTGEVLKFAPVNDAWRRIVGVVGSTQDGGPEARPRAVVFMPFAQAYPMLGGLVIRTDGDAPAVAAQATSIVRRIAPTAPVERVLTVAQIREEGLSPRRTSALLASSFGVLAIIIAAVGIAAVLAFSVGARTNEIGIRMSLGASSGGVQRMILGEGGILVALGLVPGVAGGVAVARAMRELLVGVAPYDPLTLAVVSLIMAVIGLAACWLPALRAARIDPALAMRL